MLISFGLSKQQVITQAIKQVFNQAPRISICLSLNLDAYDNGPSNYLKFGIPTTQEQTIKKFTMQ